MRIYNETGEFELPEGMQIEIEINNPMVSQSGSSSIPLNIPATRQNLIVADHPDQFCREYPIRNGYECIVQHGTFQIQGKLDIDTCTENAIRGSIAFQNNSIDKYDSERSLKSILGGYRYSGLGSGIDMIMRSIQEGYEEETAQGWDKHQLVVFPVKCRIAEGLTITLNESEDQSDEYGIWFGDLIYNARSYKVGDITYNVPKGYGITLFPYLGYIIEEILSKIGYTVRTNDFNKEPYRNLVLLNAVPDMICTGDIYLRDFVPDITFKEFTEWLQKEFGAYMFFSNGEANVHIIAETLKTAPTVDLTSYIQDDETVSIPQASAVRIEADTSIEGSAPADETWNLFKSKYPTIKQVAAENNIGNVAGIYYCKGTGDFWKGDGTYKHIRLGSDLFPMPGKYMDESENSIKSSGKALSTSYLQHYRPSPYMVFVGDACHYHTGIKDEEEKQEHNLMTCWAYYDKYWQGTFTGQRSDGEAPFESLSPIGRYSLFFREYNKLLLNSAPEVTVTINIPEDVLSSMDPLMPVRYKNNMALIKSLSYALSDNGISYGTTTLIIIPDIIYPRDTEPIEIL